jgi:hypothetical protein
MSQFPTQYVGGRLGGRGPTASGRLPVAPAHGRASHSSCGCLGFVSERLLGQAWPGEGDLRGGAIVPAVAAAALPLPPGCCWPSSGGCPGLAVVAPARLARVLRQRPRSRRRYSGWPPAGAAGRPPGRAGDAAAAFRAAAAALAANVDLFTDGLPRAARTRFGLCGAAVLGQTRGRLSRRLIGPAGNSTNTSSGFRRGRGRPGPT